MESHQAVHGGGCVGGCVVNVCIMCVLWWVCGGVVNVCIMCVLWCVCEMWRMSV